MAKKQDPLIDSLMALAVSAAPLIERARASGIFKHSTRDDDVEEIVLTPEPVADSAASAQKSALQDIIVSQAMKIAALEAELAALKAKP